MNRIVKHILSAAMFSSLHGYAFADGVAVVPGETKGYLYDIASNQPSDGKEISLTVVKSGHFKEYVIESADGALRCDEHCPETSQRVPAGSVSLVIKGKKPISFLDIPLTGIWSDPCSDTTSETATCVFNLTELNARVSVEVDPDIKVGTTLGLPEGGEGLIVKIDTRDGYILMAAHERLDPGKRWLRFDRNRTSKMNINSLFDGRINVEKLLAIKPPSEAAKYCADMGNGWYLPAANELALLTRDALKKVTGINADSYIWSSTESSLEYCKTKCGGKRNPDKPYLYLKARIIDAENGSLNDGTVYKYTYEPDGSWTQSDARLYQVLCFRRLAI